MLIESCKNPYPFDDQPAKKCIEPVQFTRSYLSDCQHSVPFAVDSFLGEELYGDPLVGLHLCALPLPGDQGGGLPSKPNVVAESVALLYLDIIHSRLMDECLH